MGRVRVVDTSGVYDAAIKQRKVFHGSVSKKRQFLSSPWPKQLAHIGKCVAAIYYSNKSLSGGKWEVYKHIAEAGQDLFINPDTTTLFNRYGQEIAFVVDDVARPNPEETDEEYVEQFLRETGLKGQVVPIFGCSLYEVDAAMPRYITALAEDRGIQAVLLDGSYYEMRLPKAMWGSGILPKQNEGDKDEVFLVLYSREGIHFLVTGDDLDITLDGITG